MAEEVSSVLNINVGILGHVDSGKTSIARALSTVGSTAAFDKNPQSQERGITLDLGFSCFSMDMPERFKHLGLKTLQITLVDCPGHASLIRTIIGGAQIIDFMMLVIDVTKGIQTQTAECLVIGEICWDRMVVVLNKADMFPAETRAAQLDKVKAKLAKVFQATKFKDPPMICISAAPGDGAEPQGVKELAALLRDSAPEPVRRTDGPLVFAVDHCFPIKGQGTVMTGTVLSGTVRVNDTVDIPSLKMQKKIKSMQMFRRSVSQASQGDRVGVCVTQFDSKLLERGIVCSPGAVITTSVIIAEVQPIRFYKAPCESRSKFHVSIGYHTVMATVSFFCDPNDQFAFSKEYLAEDLLYNGSAPEGAEPVLTFPGKQYALLELEGPVICLPDALMIASRLDTDIHVNTCRLAFTGHVVAHTDAADYRKTFLPRLLVFKRKRREGVVDRLHDSDTVIGRNLFKKETQLDAFSGLKVTLSTGEQGVIDGGFGQTGKFKVRCMGGLQPATLALLKKGKKSKDKEAKEAKDEEGEAAPITIALEFKRYLYDESKKMVQ